MLPIVRSIKNALKPLVTTPLHPQWLSRVGRKHLENLIRGIPEGSLVLDIGCFNKWPSKLLPKSCTYIGADYPETAISWYASRPDVFCDAADLPINSACIDAVLLLDVLEHLENSEQAVQEIGRVLKKDGLLILQVPFMYPLHDEPRDYRRITSHGFERLAQRQGYQLVSLRPVGRPMETAGLLLNIAMARQIINWVSRMNPLMLLIMVLPVTTLFVNTLCKVVALAGGGDGMMPFSYQVLLKKK